MEGGGGAAAAGLPPASRRRGLDEAAAPPTASHDGQVVEGGANRAAQWFASLNIRDYFASPAGEVPQHVEAFDKVKDALVDLDRLATRQLDVARRQAATLNSHTTTLETITAGVQGHRDNLDEVSRELAKIGHEGPSRRIPRSICPTIPS